MVMQFKIGDATDAFKIDEHEPCLSAGIKIELEVREEDLKNVPVTIEEDVESVASGCEGVFFDDTVCLGR